MLNTLDAAPGDLYDYMIKTPSDRLFKVIVGLEIHTQIQAETKLFSNSPAAYGGLPNHHVSLFDAAIPGTLPTLNRHCLMQAIKTGLALRGHISRRTRFDRKHYLYPDLPLGYQITQLWHPIVTGGTILVSAADPDLEAHIPRIQLETDSGKSIHDQFDAHTLVDFNRHGVALLEIVVDPDLRSSQQATQLVRKLQLILRLIGVSNGNMEEGSIRVDANVNVLEVREAERSGAETQSPPASSPRCEIKNLNSLRALARGIEFEAHRHVEHLERGMPIESETRFYDPVGRLTTRGRDKTSERGYYFMVEPNLNWAEVSDQMVQEAESTLPELPDETVNRMQRDYGIPQGIATILTSAGAALYFDRVMARLAATSNGRASPQPLMVAKWIVNELFHHLDASGEGSISHSPVTEDGLAEILGHVIGGSISSTAAKNVIAGVFGGDRRPIRDILVEDQHIQRPISHEELQEICRRVLAQFPEEVKAYRQGNRRMMQMFIGKVVSEHANRTTGQQVARVMQTLISEFDME